MLYLHKYHMYLWDIHFSQSVKNFNDSNSLLALASLSVRKLWKRLVL